MFGDFLQKTARQSGFFFAHAFGAREAGELAPWCGGAQQTNIPEPVRFCTISVSEMFLKHFWIVSTKVRHKTMKFSRSSVICSRYTRNEKNGKLTLVCPNFRVHLWTKVGVRTSSMNKSWGEITHFGRFWKKLDWLDSLCTNCRKPQPFFARIFGTCEVVKLVSWCGVAPKTNCRKSAWSALSSFRDVSNVSCFLNYLYKE